MSSAQAVAVPQTVARAPDGIGFPLRLLLVTLPIMPSPLMLATIFGVGALRPSNIVLAVALLSFIGRASERVRIPQLDKLQRRALLWFALYLLLFLVAFIRSVPNLPRFTAIFPDLFSTDVIPYVDYEFIVPLLYALCFIYVVVLVRSTEELLDVVSAIATGVVIQAVVVIYCFAQNPQIMDADDRIGIKGLTDQVLGMHYNDVAATYITTGPLLLYFALKRGGGWVGIYVLSVLAVLLLESRTGIFVFAATSFITLLAVGHARVSLPWIVLAVGGCVAVLGRVLVKLLATGISGPYGFSLYFLLSGRLEKIWTPLLVEWTTTSNLFWFGAGEYGMLTSRILASGIMLMVAQAHNAYLEFFLDNGIVLFVVFAAALLFLLFRGWWLGRRLHCGLYWSLLFCLIGFLLSCFSGRRFFPQPENAMIFPVLAVLVSTARLKLRQMQAIAR